MPFFTRKFWTEGPGSFAVAITLALMVRWALFEAYVIPSTSMLPTLLVHDHIFVNKIVYGIRAPFSERWIVQWRHPERGEVVVFKHPADRNKYFIKRLSLELSRLSPMQKKWPSGTVKGRSKKRAAFLSSSPL